jgi:hypothetical protein
MEPVVNGIESKGDVESDEVIKKQEHTWIDNNKSHSNLIFDSHIELKVIRKCSKFFSFLPLICINFF